MSGAIRAANAAPRCGARSKRTGKSCQGAAMPNGAAHAGGPSAQQAGKLETRALSREAKAERSRLRAAILALRDLCDSI